MFVRLVCVVPSKEPCRRRNDVKRGQLSKRVVLFKKDVRFRGCRKNVQVVLGAFVCWLVGWLGGGLIGSLVSYT